jgi:hypothetical protein
MSEADNHRHWDASKRGAYEVWYTTWNHPKTDQGFWLRFITEAPFEGPPRAELWFARFDPDRPDKTFGIHKPFPADRLSSSTSPFTLQIADAQLRHDQTFGELAGDGHEISWDLHWVPAQRALRMMPDVAYRGVGETTALSPNPRIAISGTLLVDGEKLDFDHAIGGQTHLWGKKHAYSWTWGRCAEFAGADGALLEILGTRLQRRGIVLPPLVFVELDLDGEHHRLNQLRHAAVNRASWRTGHVAFKAWSPTLKIEGELSCLPHQLVNAPYLDPDGTAVWCANTEIGDASIVVYKRSGMRWLEHRRLEGRRRAHFETGGRARDPEVTRDHVLVEK